jgi:hypothetical protein
LRCEVISGMNILFRFLLLLLLLLLLLFVCFLLARSWRINGKKNIGVFAAL